MPRDPLRLIAPWLVAVSLLVASGAGVVVWLNATTFGAGGFVSVYLDALARDSVTEALSLPGVAAGTVGSTGSTGSTGSPGSTGSTGAPSDALLRDGTLAGLSDLHQIGDDERGGIHYVTFDWNAPHGSGTTTFQVERVGTRFGLFPEWEFAVSPLATVSLTVANDPRFTLNGVNELSAATTTTPVDYAVLVPGAYVFAHTSRYLTAAPVAVVADTVNERLSNTVDTEANPLFVRTVASLVQTQLTTCATQTVLYPTGCPFGQSVENRLASTPAWSIVHQPRIAITPGGPFGSWLIPSTAGTAHLTVKVTSLLDGSASEFDQDVPFPLQGDITLGTGVSGTALDAITVTLH